MPAEEEDDEEGNDPLASLLNPTSLLSISFSRTRACFLRFSHRDSSVPCMRRKGREEEEEEGREKKKKRRKKKEGKKRKRRQKEQKTQRTERS